MENGHFSYVRRMPHHIAVLSAGVALALVGVAALSVSFYQAGKPSVYAITLPSGDDVAPLSYGSWPALAERTFYERIRQQIIESGAPFFAADLEAMTLTLYRDGEEQLTVPIVSKGKKGTWWETPAGLYEIQDKHPNRFLSFEDVYYPWSLSFQGNFSIHGPPAYSDGAPVPSDYEGGCVWLSAQDARTIYEFADAGMPVLVYEASAEQETFLYQYKLPDINATAFVAADLENGTVLVGNNTSVQLPIASVTKLMTALIAAEFLPMDMEVMTPREAVVETTVPRLSVGKKYRVHDLLVILLTESSNEAAEVLASALGRDKFLQLMNEKAISIGMSRTSFIDPSGLGVGNSSTVEDMFTLVKHVYENRSFILDLTRGETKSDLYGAVAFKNISNFNKVPRAKNEFYGGKVGQTLAARETYAGVFGHETAKGVRPMVVVVLGSPAAKESTAKLLEYLDEYLDETPRLE